MTVRHGQERGAWNMNERSAGAADGRAGDTNLSRRGLEEASNDAEQRRLAAARPADERDELVVPDLEVDAG